MAAELLRVEVCYASPNHIWLRQLALPPGTTIEQAIRQSAILQEVPGLVLDASRVGEHGKLKPVDSIVRDGDRIEIYRPLLADPKDARRRRAVRQKRAAG